MKKVFALLTAFALTFAIVGCSTSKKEESSEKKTESTKEVSTKQAQTKMYNAVRVAETKVNELFHKDTAADQTTPVLNLNFADEAAATTFLLKYYSEEIAKDIVKHYVTDQKTAEGNIIVKADSYFTKSILETTQQDVTIKGDEKKGTIKTKDHVEYTVELKDNTYMITNIKK